MLEREGRSCLEEGLVRGLPSVVLKNASNVADAARVDDDQGIPEAGVIESYFMNRHG
jgi:hypothetical protein